jgi:hypothetical protein
MYGKQEQAAFCQKDMIETISKYHLQDQPHLISEEELGGLQYRMLFVDLTESYQSDYLYPFAFLYSLSN